MSSPQPDPQHKHPIGVVSRRTGLKQDLIRAWERRYSAVEPVRTNTRRRLYSDADIERLLLLREAVGAGRSIGQVAELPDQELEELIADDKAAVARARRSAPRHPAPPVSWRGDTTPPTDDEGADTAALLEICLSAVQRLDARDLEVQLERASVSLSRIHLVEQVLVPLLHAVGDLWQEGSLRPAHEHMASSVLRSFLGDLGSSRREVPGAPLLLATTPVRQHHEMGALIASACASSEGWNVIYLGPDLPAEEIAAAALQKNARAVALSITYPPDDSLLGAELEKLGRLLPGGSTLLVGGRSAGAYRTSLESIGAQQIDDMTSLRRELAQLRSDRTRPLT